MPEHGCPTLPQPAARLEIRAYEHAREAGRYEIIGEHARGGIGRVSRAYDRDLGRDVAIKELIARNHVSEVRFLREAMITARLEHPGIVPVHEAGRWHDGTPFYAMKLVAGRPLRDLLAERTTVDDRIALLHHVIAVADAIAYAHRRQVIHRDLKPGNVIVGDFGETVVIDWGLAKDLSASLDSDDLAPTSPSPAGRLVGDLTATGSVLGTPAYMAPEQARGAPVDQRVDVFAIGAMLWELCAVEKVPPTSLRRRHTLLRRNGIDRDLITILDKALAPHPADRYRDAGALAADLKAFKAGARIAARDYSLPALLAHWMRRHRALALSLVAALVLTLAGATFYLRSVAAERDRADASQSGEQHARVAAESALNELTLRHAQQLLTSDPSSALDELATYRGHNTSRARQIAAEARGRGAAVLRAAPHRDNIAWATIIPGPAATLEAVISLSADGTIARTAADGSSRVLARNVASIGRADYAAGRRLLAYICDPADICFFDVARGVQIASSPLLRGTQAISLNLSPSEGSLAVVGRTGKVTVFDIHDPAHPVVRLERTIPTADFLLFIDDTTLAVSGHQQIDVIPFDGAPTRLALHDYATWNVDPRHRRLIISMKRGATQLVGGPAWRTSHQADLCHGPAVFSVLYPVGRQLAYSCYDGTVGVWDPDTGAIMPRFHRAGHGGPMRVSPDQRYLVASDGLSMVYVLDLVSNLVTTYKGSEYRPTAITPPTGETPYFVTSDARGAIRAWPVPSRIAKVATSVEAPFYAAVFVPGSDDVIATSLLDQLTVFSPTTGARQVGGHDAFRMWIETARDHRSFAAYARFNPVVELWSLPAVRPMRTLTTPHGSLSNLRFLPDGDLVTSGSDGQILRWHVGGDDPPAATPLAQLAQPVDDFALVPATHAVVFQARDGSLWQTSTSASPNVPIIALRGPGPRTSRAIHMMTWRDGFSVYAGLDDGDLLAIDTRDHRIATVLHASGAIRDFSVTPDATAIAVSIANGGLQVATRGTPSAPWTWRQIELPTVHHTLTADGILVALTKDSAIWFYDLVRDRWLCVPAGNLDFRHVEIDPSGDAAVAFNLDGKLIWIDLVAARAQLAGAR